MFRFNPFQRTLFIAAQLSAFSQGLLAPLFAVFVQSIGGTAVSIGGAWALFQIMSGIVIIGLGRVLGDGLRCRMLVLIAGYAANAILCFAYPFVHAMHQLVVLQLLQGAALALTNPTWSSLFAHYSQENGCDSWGSANGMFYIVSGIALIVGTGIVTLTSFQFCSSRWESCNWQRHSSSRKSSSTKPNSGLPSLKSPGRRWARILNPRILFLPETPPWRTI